MTPIVPAGDHAPRAQARPGRAPRRVRVDSLDGVLAVVPYLLGFQPSSSLVVLGLGGPRGRISIGFRYDLPDPPGRPQSGEIAEHATDVLGRQHIRTAFLIGYGPGALVTPVVDVLRPALDRSGIAIRDILRVEDGRYWSYTCQDPRCCPADGVPFSTSGHPAAAALSDAGLSSLGDRAALARTLEPAAGAQESMQQATDRALHRVAGLMQEAVSVPGGGDAMRLVIDSGRRAVQDAVSRYRAGGSITSHDKLAWLSVTVADLRVRDDAWARMEPEFAAAHRRLWTDLVRLAQPAYVPAPASLLAFTAWQSGKGALARMAVERALAADPDYSMALLLDDALAAGLPPSAARLPMTPEEVAASYAGTDRHSGPEPAARRARRRPSG